MTTTNEVDIDMEFRSVGQKNAYYKDVYLPDFARDVVLYGKNDAHGILSAYNISADDFVKISKLPLFLSEIAQLKKKLEESDNAMVQIKATETLEMAVLSLQSRILRAELSNRELIDATKVLMDLSGARQIKIKGGGGDIIGPVNTGTVVKIAYGGNLDAIQQIPENMPVNETYDKIKANFGIVDAEYEENK